MTPPILPKKPNTLKSSLKLMQAEGVIFLLLLSFMAVGCISPAPDPVDAKGCQSLLGSQSPVEAFVHVGYDSEYLSSNPRYFEEYGRPPMEEVNLTLRMHIPREAPDVTIHPDRFGCARFSLEASKRYWVAATWLPPNESYADQYYCEWQDDGDSFTAGRPNPTYVNLNLTVACVA